VNEKKATISYISLAGRCHMITKIDKILPCGGYHIFSLVSQCWWSCRIGKYHNFLSKLSWFYGDFRNISFNWVVLRMQIQIVGEISHRAGVVFILYGSAQ